MKLNRYDCPPSPHRSHSWCISGDGKSMYVWSKEFGNHIITTYLSEKNGYNILSVFSSEVDFIKGVVGMIINVKDSDKYQEGVYYFCQDYWQCVLGYKIVSKKKVIKKKSSLDYVRVKKDSESPIVILGLSGTKFSEMEDWLSLESEKIHIRNEESSRKWAEEKRKREEEDDKLIIKSLEKHIIKMKIRLNDENDKWLSNASESKRKEVIDNVEMWEGQLKILIEIVEKREKE